MCGIFYSLSRCHKDVDVDYGPDEEFNETLSRRGPDIKGELKMEFNGWQAKFIGHVLWTQGFSPTKQPLTDSYGNILLWNGDVFNGPFASEDGCDSSEILKKLSCNGNSVLFCLTQVVGPYSFIYWDNVNKCLWFGRDVFGRHSLLWLISSDYVLITSSGNKHAKDLLEVPAVGLFMLDLKDSLDNLELNFFPWKHSMNELKIDIGISVDICETTSHAIIKNGEKEAEWFKEEPKFHDIEIYKTICNQAGSSNDILKKCLENNEILNRVESLINILSKSVELRVNKQPNLCRKCTFSKDFHCSHSKIGILFSGGLDSTVLAILANKYVPLHESIDLYNVAFQNPAKKIMNFNVPDRKTGEIAFEELKKLSPLRKWNFIKVDVTHDELVTWRQNLIAHLIHPLNTVLDDSLGCTLWFASRGQGVLSTGQPYSSYARVILLGLGADEMLGGYMRHRTQWRRERSWKTLALSLANDLDIIGRRNLGRDNRVLANHGCQPRLPYLDEHVVAFIQSLPPWHRCCLSDEMPLGIGDKLLLRLAAWKLGLCKVATFPKRAMQFGSCIANSHESGNSVSHRL